MEDKLKKIYDLYIKRGLLTQESSPYEKWLEASEDQQIKLFELGQKKGLFSKDTPVESFTSLWSVKKKDGSEVIGEEEVMVSDGQQDPDAGTLDVSDPLQVQAPQGEVVEEEVVEEQIGGQGPEIRGQAPRDTQSLPTEQNTLLEDVAGKWWLTDFVGDIYRAGKQGLVQGGTSDEGWELMMKGASSDPQDIAEFLAAQEKLQALGETDEMRRFNEIYEESGGGALGFLKGLAYSPLDIIGQLGAQTLMQMFNPASAGAAAAAVGTGTAIGGVPGAIASLPAAYAASGAALETGLSFAEFLREEVEKNGDNFDQAGIQKVLNDEDAMFNIRAKSAGRGAVIGIIDRYTMKMGGKIIKGQAARGVGKGKRALTAMGTEAVGGGVGEATARGVVGQDMDAREIGFETIGGTGKGVMTYGYGQLISKPVYKINPKSKAGPGSGVVDVETMSDMITKSSDKDFAAMEFTIENDPELKRLAEARQKKLKKQNQVLAELGRQNIKDKATLDELVALELEKDALGSPTTEGGKKRLADIQARINGILEGTIDVEATRTEDEAGNVVETRVEISEEYAKEQLQKEGIENPTAEQIEVKQAELMEEGRNIINQQKQDDAIQKPSTETVDVQVQAEDGRTVGDGDTEANITREGQQEEQTPVGQETQEEVVSDEVLEESQDLESLFPESEETVVEETETVEETPEAQTITEDETVLEESESVTENEEGGLNIINNKTGETVVLKGRKDPENNNLYVTEDTEASMDPAYENIEAQNKQESFIINLAKKGGKAISKILPGVNIILHRTESAYNSATNQDSQISQGKKGSKGLYTPGTNDIHINMSHASAKTIAHEVFHALLYNKYGSDEKVAAVTQRMAKAIKNKVTDPELKKQLEEVSNRYTDFKNEEYLAELVGTLAAKYKTLKASEQNIVKKWINKVGKMLGMTEDVVDADTEVANLLQNLADNIREGKEIVDADLQALDTMDETAPIADPTTIKKPTGKERQEIEFKENYDMSLITPENKIDLLGLVDEIVAKNQKVWFWVADQLGKGEFNGIEMDAGPSYALDPTNLAANIIWASGMKPKAMANNVEKADYIFIISGSPQASKLFNKKVFDAFANKLGDFAQFKKEALASKPIKAIRDVLNKYDSWPALRRNPDRKTFLSAIVQQQSTPNTALHQLIKSKDGFIDLNSLRDGFYQENNFEQNDVMMVLKPTEVGGKSEHSTYETNILGEVVGVPDIKLDAFEIMPESVKAKYEGKEMGRVLKTQVVAPYGTGVKKIAKPKRKKAGKERQQISPAKEVTKLAQQNGINEKGFFPASLWNPGQLKNRLQKLGFGLKPAYRSYGDRGLTGYYITKNGRKFNPPVNERMEVAFTNKDSNQEVVDKAREMDFSDASIKDYLQRVRKVAKEEVDALLKKSIDLFESIPAAFGNVEGGMNVGKEIFDAVNTELNKFIAKEKPTAGEKRVKGLSILEANPLFKKQPKSVQNELISAYDRSLQTTANRQVQKKVAAVRKAIRDFKDGKRSFKESKMRLKNLIRKALPKGEYSKSVVERVGNILANASEKTFLTDSEKILEIVSKQRDKQKKTLIGKLAKVVASNAKKALTQSNKVRSKGKDAAGQQFFKAVNTILKAALSPDGALTIQALREKLSKDNVEVGGKVLNVRETLDKAMKGEKMAVKEQMLVEQIYALDTFGDVMNMSLEDVQNLYEGVKDVRAESIKRLAAKRLAQVEAQAKLDAEAEVQIKENYPFLFNEDGTLKDKNKLDQDWRDIWQSFKDRKIWEGLKKFVKVLDFTKITGLTDFMRQKIAHLGTLTNLVDNVAKGNNFFTENVYNRINRMETKSLEGKQAEMESMNKGLGRIANTIEGITKGYKEWKQKIPKGYRKIYVKGKETNLTIDEMMRIYALSKNDIQRAKLEKMGYDAEVLDQITREIGPLATEFIDKAVEYLSNEYFEETNNVYRQVNNVNLGYVANYFPTRTLSPNVDNLIMEDGGANFSGVFSAEYDSAFKQRVDRESDVDLGAGFTSVLESHIESMERYKAFAEGTKTLNNIFQSPAVNTLIQEMGVKSVMKNIINVAINPQSGLRQSRTLLAKTLSRFTEYALSFKLIQIPKQATSFVNALEDYSYRGPGKKTPGLDTLMFMIDMAKVIATLPQQIKKARTISPDFSNRLKQGLEGDVYGLESGSRTFKPLSNTQAKSMWERFKIGAASPTIIGDVMGVMGYMANYNRNIANGMSKAEALEAFNNYNATQQSRRGADKNMLQLSGDELTRVFTMFGSTLFLQMNKVMSSTTNLMKALKEGKKADSQRVIKDSRALALNFAIANVLFVATANMFKISESEEDEEEVMERIKDAARGLNLLYQIPLIGGASEMIINKIKGQRGYGDDVINPYKSVARKISKGIAADSKLNTARPLMEIIIGAQLDPFIGLYNILSDQGDVDKNMYDLLGVSPSYQPNKVKSSGKKSKTEGIGPRGGRKSSRGTSGTGVRKAQPR